LSPEAHDQEDLRVPAWWIAGLTLVALALRLAGLDGGLWIDEIYSLLGSFRPPLAQIVTEFPGDNQHPLYSVLAHVSLTLFGESAWSVRLPAVLFGVASVPLLYALGARVASRREGLLAAALLTVSYHHIWFSQNARGYSALAFFAMLATLLLLRGLERRSAGPYLGYAIAASLGAYTHLTMVFVVIGHAAVIGIRNIRRDPPGRRWRDGAGPWIGFALAGIITLLWYAPILTRVQQFFLHHPSGLKGVSTPSWAAQEAIRGLMQGLGAGTGVLAAAVVVAAALLFGVGLASYARSAPLALGLFVAPGVVTIFGAVGGRGTIYPRFYLALIGCGILIGVRGAMVAADRIATRWSARDARRMGDALGTAVVATMIVLSAASLGFNYRYPKQDFDGARQWLETSRGAEDRIVTVGATTMPYHDWMRLPWPSAKSAKELGELRRGVQRTWVVYTLPRYLEYSAPDLMRMIRQDCPTSRVFPGTLGGGDIVVCTLAPVAASASANEPR